MNDWLRGVGGAALTGLTWAAAWVPAAALIGTMDLAASADRIWVPLPQPALLCGAIFAAVTGTSRSRRRLDEAPLLRFAVMGFVIGLFPGALPFAISQPTTDLPLWLLAAEVIGPVALLSAVSAVGTVLVVRVRGARAGRA